MIGVLDKPTRSQLSRGLVDSQTNQLAKGEFFYTMDRL